VVSSGTTAFAPSLGDLTLEAFARCQIHPPSLTANHFYQARMSANLLLADWNVEDGPNAWKQDLLAIPTVPGVATYALPTNVIAVTDWFIRQFQVGNPVNLSSVFTTTLGSASVNVNQPNHGMAVGNWMSVVVQIAVGGIVLFGFYEIAAVVDVNNYTIAAASNATSSVVAGGLTPSFATTLGSPTVTVTLANHGLVVGVPFSVPVAVTVGGLTLSGSYAVASVTSSSVFTITAPANAASGETVSENAGQAQLENQLPNVAPLDRVIVPISRTEYAAQPNKEEQGFPTSVFFLRTINPTATLWMVPDGNGPYVLYAWTVTQIQDAVMNGGVTMDMPQRFFEAFASGLAAKLARKFPPPPPTTVAELKQEAAEAWMKASKQDAEEGVGLFISPGLSSYYR
jgi:hypothetical protein